MWMNEGEIKWAHSRRHADLNVRKGIHLLLRLMEAVNEQSDGWHSWPAPSKAAEPLMDLLMESAGNLWHDTHGTISDAALQKVVKPIKAMVTRQKRIQKRYGNSFDFDVEAALREAA